MNREIKERNVIVVYLLCFLTFGLYALYWSVSTKRDINSLGGDIPTTWICLIPFAGLYYSYKYCEGYAKFVAKDNNTLLYFCLSMFFGIVMPALVQSELNKIAGKPRDNNSKGLRRAA